ncbi:MAG: hypothetical protein QXG03_01715 [Halalkalicoccus sp.]
MELTLILIAISVLLALLSPIAFAIFLFTRDRESTSDEGHVEA